MKNKIIVLMLLMPLVLLFAVMSLTGAVSVALDIPVTGISIRNTSTNGVLTLDIASYRSDMYLEVEIYPAGALNNGYTIENKTISGDGEVAIDGDGLIVPIKAGKVKLTAISNDGGFRDSVIVNVISTKALDVRFGVIGYHDGAEQAIESAASSGLVVYNTSVICGTYSLKAAAYPASALKAEASFRYIGAIQGTEDGFWINPITGVFTASKCGEYSVLATMSDGMDGNIERMVNIRATGEELTGTAPTGEYKIVSRFYSAIDKKLYQKVGTTVGYTVVDTATLLEFGGDIEFFAEGGAEIVSATEGTCRIKALSEGTARIRAILSLAGERIAIDADVNIVLPITSMTFDANTLDWGIGGVLAAGDNEIINGGYVPSNYDIDLSVWSIFDIVAEGSSQVEFSSSDKNIASTGMENFKPYLTINDNGRINIRVQSLYEHVFYDNIYDELTVDCVKDGVNIKDYPSLVKATEDGKAVVLTSDVMLGENLKNADGSLKPDYATKLGSYVKSLPMTADWNYYLNTRTSRPDINYCLEFKNDIYGNGYTICADNITQITPEDSALAVFKGPVDFVSFFGQASVKSQDNIVFLVRTDGVTLNNVVLKGCLDENLYGEHGLELSYLTYGGTVLELMSDASIKNCRISNGRTVVRAFGRSDVDIIDSQVDMSERIDVRIESCVLSNAREFILKIGTNRKVDGKYSEADPETLAPSLLRADGSVYLPRVDSNAADNYFTDNYVLTHVTVKNCAFASSGLFSIGVECAFAGEMLDGEGVFGFLSSRAGWNGLCGTSYAAVLKLEDDVRFYDWKPLDMIDSSTLIEAVESNELNRFLKLDIKSMIEQVVKVYGGNYKHMITERSGRKYVHGGIAFYGGGKNYSALDLSDFSGQGFEDHRVNLSVLSKGTDPSSLLYVQGDLLPSAAGKEDFRFMMYGASGALSISEQERLLKEGGAYGFIKPGI